MQSLKDDELILSGPARTGKSLAWLIKLNDLAWQHEGMRALIVRKTRVSLSESGLVTFERMVLGEDNPICAGAQRANRSLYTYPNGSQIVVGGIDRPSRIMSTEFDFIYVQEASELTLDDWESLMTRLSNGVMPFQQIGGDTNPDRPDHWIVKRAEAGLLKMLDTRHEDNPALFDERGQKTVRGDAYLRKLDKLTGVRRLRLRDGKWVMAEGAVYEDWNAAVHVIDRFEIPGTWRRLRSIDFGYTNPFVCQWWAVDPDGRMYLYRELYRSQRTVSQHAALINTLSGSERYETTVADHDAEDRATLEQHGIYSTPARKEIKVGIEKVQERLAAAGDGKPRLFILRDSLAELDDDLADAGKPVSTIDEVGGYTWPKGRDGKAAKETPVDVDNHGLDAMRYAVMAIDGGVQAVKRTAVTGLYPSARAGMKRTRPRT